MTKKDWIGLVVSLLGILAIEGAGICGAVKLYEKGIEKRLEATDKLMDKMQEAKELQDKLFKEEEAQ